MQLPPRWKRNVERLDEFLALMPTTMRCAVELRDPSWVHDDVFDVLRRHSAALCIHDLLPSHPFELTTDWTYVRFHGPDAVNNRTTVPTAPFASARGPNACSRWSTPARDVYAYFNNDWYGHAVNDARLLRAQLSAI